MKEEWLAPYKEEVGGDGVHLPGNTSCSRDMKVALGFALDKPKPDHHGVLFVISVRNFDSPDGIQMNNEAYTAYPEEGELLLIEGKRVWVLAVEKGITIKNLSQEYQAYNDKVVSIVHLHSSW